MKEELRKITIAFIFHDAFLFSGATRSLLDIIDEVSKNKKFELVAIFPVNKGDAIDHLKNKNIKIICSKYSFIRYCFNSKSILNFLRKAKLYYKYVQSVFKIKYELVPIIKELNVDVVYTNTSVITVGALINKYCSIPHIWHFREFGEEDQHRKTMFGEYLYYKLVNNHSNRVIVISKALLSKYEKRVQNRLLYQVYNDISPKYINYCKKNTEKDALDILIVGAIIEEKGQDQVIKAVSYLINKGLNIKLSVVGEPKGDYYNSLVKYVTDNGLEQKILFLGVIKDLCEIRKKSDVGVVTSKSEAFGRVTIEGMLSCMTMIGADCCGTSELIKDNETGMLYTFGDYVELSKKIEYLYHNRNEINKLGTKGYEFALQFTKGNCAHSIENMVIDLCKSDN